MRALDARIRERLKQYSTRKRAAIIGLGVLSASILSPIGLTGAVVYRGGLTLDSINNRIYNKQVEKARERQKAAEAASRQATARAAES
jgi:hypothetical protein